MGHWVETQAGECVGIWSNGLRGLEDAMSCVGYLTLQQLRLRKSERIRWSMRRRLALGIVHEQLVKSVDAFELRHR